MAKSKKKKPTIALCMIVKDEEEILQKCIDHVKDIVDEFCIVDTGSTDGTKEIIAKYQKKVHEIPFENYVDTKNKAIALCKSDYILWMDADEVLYQNAKTLKEYTLQEIAAVSCFITEGPADYSVVATQYQRVRLFKNDGSWKFAGPGVHEYLTGEGKTVFDNTILVRHEHLKKNKAVTARDRFYQYIALLKGAIQKDENNARAWFYLGRTYKDVGEPMLAVSAYQKYLSIPENYFRDERWQAANDMAECLKGTGDYEQAIDACNLALSIDGRRAETYCLLGNIFFMLQNYENAINCYKQAASTPVPEDVILFLTPKSYNEIPKDQLVLCYYKTKQYAEAEKLSDEIKGTSTRLLNNLWWVRMKTKQRIFFVLGKTPEPVWGGMIEQQGVHGVETTYIELPKEFARKGYDVFLFCNTAQEHVYDGVYYIPFQNLPNYQCLEPNIVVTSRDFDVLYQMPTAKKIIWLQDAHFAPPQYPDAFSKADAVVCSSLWHRCYIAEKYGDQIEAKNLYIIPLGIRKDLFVKAIQKEHLKVIYSSNPDRGLYILADMWAELTEKVKGIHLTICYGWEGLKTWGDSPEWKASVEGQRAFLLDKMSKFDNVRFTGRITKKQLAEEMLSSDMMLYSNNFPETFCLTTLEAQIAGTPIITTDMGALSTTIDRDLNFLLKGSPYSEIYQRQFINKAVELLTNKPLLQDYQMRNRVSMLSKPCDWSDVVEQWERLIWEF